MVRVLTLGLSATRAPVRSNGHGDTAKTSAADDGFACEL